ncbi:alpha/beta fold hydrolase [Mycobacterium heidelbergense]|uniref:alpha/beta fold hydrolase n=1 Tax=Mycobacterium heidelbergense TaxID=53376 RepID=UPI003CE9AF37
MNAGPDAGNSRPVLLLVHGAFFGAWIWDELRLDLAARGWKTEAVDLPSTADRGRPRLGLFEDAEMVRQRLKEIGSPVVVVAHSYGGAVVTQAAADLPNVRHLVYVSAFQFDIGESVLGVVGEPPEWWNVEGDILTAHNPRTVFLDDVPQEAAERAIARLKPTSLCVTSQRLTAAAWHEIPSTHIVTDRDKAATPAALQFLAARATHVRHLPSGHVPLLSMPSALADLVVEAANTTI